MSHKHTAGSAEFIMPEAVNLPERRPFPGGTADGGHASAEGPSSAFLAVPFNDTHRYQQRYTAQVNMLTDHFSPSALYLARKADPQPYTPLTLSAMQAHVQPTDYALRPPSYHSHQAVVDFYRACHGRYGVSVNFDPAAQSSSGGSGSNSTSLSPLAGGPAGAGPTEAAHAAAAASTFTLLTLGSHAHGGRGLGARAARKGSTGGGPAAAGETTASAASSPPALGMEDYRVAQLRRNVQHMDTQVCLYFGTKEGCRRGDQCDFLHVHR